MMITTIAPPTIPPIIPPETLILGLGDVDAEGSGMEVVVGKPSDERDPVKRIVVV